MELNWQFLVLGSVSASFRPDWEAQIDVKDLHTGLEKGVKVVVWL